MSDLEDRAQKWSEMMAVVEAKARAHERWLLSKRAEALPFTRITGRRLVALSDVLDLFESDAPNHRVTGGHLLDAQVLAAFNAQFGEDTERLKRLPP